MKRGAAERGVALAGALLRRDAGAAPPAKRLRTTAGPR